MNITIIIVVITINLEEIKISSLDVSDQPFRP